LDEKLLLLYDNERKVKHCEEECKRFEDSLGMLKRQSVRKLEEVKRKDLNNLRLQISKTTSDLHKTVRHVTNAHQVSTVGERGAS
jgi:hypothetical protein